MPIHYENLEWEGEEPGDGVRAVFRDTCTNESCRLTLAQINRLFSGDREETDGVEIPEAELTRAVTQIRAVLKPDRFF